MKFASTSSLLPPDHDEDDDGATEQERLAMLAHLDSILVVKKEFEIQEGQFEDATE